MRVKVGWKNYLINFKDEIVNDEGIQCYGTVDYLTDEISLWKVDSNKQVRCTLLHELLHAVDEMYGLDFTEETVTKLANCFYTLIEDNPNLIKLNFLEGE